MGNKSSQESLIKVSGSQNLKLKDHPEYPGLESVSFCLTAMEQELSLFGGLGRRQDCQSISCIWYRGAERVRMK